jgi:hypothetical protein
MTHDSSAAVKTYAVLDVSLQGNRHLRGNEFIT